MLIKSQEVKRHDEFIDLSKYTQVIKSNLNRALLFTLVVTMVSIIFVLSMTPVYKSTATLLIEGENNNVVSIERLVGVDTSKQEYFQTQHEIIKSNVIAKKVIERLAIGPDSSTQTLLSYSDEALRSSQSSAMLANLKAQVSDTLYSLPLLNTILVKPRAIKDDQLADFQKLEFLKQFKSNLHVSPIKNTQLVQITFLAEDPDVAAMVANAVGEVYIENHYESQAIINAQASDWISGRLAELEANLRQSELKLVNFMDKEGLVDVSGIDSLASAELTKLIEQLANARDRRLAAESLITVLKQNKNADASYLYTIPQVTNHPQMRDIRLSEIEAEKKVSELSKRYGPKHDKMIQAQAQLKTIQDRSKRTLQRMVAGKEKELVTARQQERSLKHELAEKKAEFQSFALKRAQYETLQREVDTNRQLYDLFLTRQKEYDATSDFRNVIAQITERAEVPFSPAKPNKPLIVAGSAAGAFSFAMIIAFATSALKNTFERRSDLKNRGQVSVFGSIPKISEKKISKSPINSHLYSDQSVGVFGESIRNIRTSLSIGLINEHKKCISVTSALPSEGKSTVALSLATSMASLEKVLLIDADFRRPSLARRFDLEEESLGLTDYLNGTADLVSCIHKDESLGLYLLPAGNHKGNPQELLSSKSFRDLVSAVGEKFDRVIIDTPSINSVIDPVLIGAATDGTLMVVKANSTQINQFKFAVGRLKEHNIEMLGAVLNQDESKTQDAYQFSGTYA